MELTKENIEKIGKLARIRLSEEDKILYAKEISSILHWIEQLGEVNTDNVPQMTSVSEMKLPWREDVIAEGNMADAVLKNAPKAEYSCFAVPKVIE